MRAKKEFLIRLIYAEMLGHDASFGYIRAVELTANNDAESKRVGYLCSSLCLSPDHQFRFMLVNVMSGDLSSANQLVVCIALAGLTKILTKDMIPVLLPKVQGLLKHDFPRVRSKAVMVLQRMHRLDPSCTRQLHKSFRGALCDRDPSVMAASLNVINDLVKVNPTSWKDLVPSFVNILKQVTEHRLPDSFDYHRIPAPWIQMKLLRILRVLGSADPRASEKMYAVLHTCIKRCDTGINVGYAIVYDCVRTITSIYPNAKLLESAATAIGRFISSDNQNLKYLGITCLANIVQDHPSYAVKHQGIVLDCLEDRDETIRRKTLALLARMTNDKNVGIVIEKSIQFLRETNDEFLRKQLVSRITSLAERYAPSTIWYVETIVTVLEIAGDIVQDSVVRSLMRIIAEGADEDEDEDEEGNEEESATDAMRATAVEAFLDLLEQPKLHPVLVQVIAWTLGEYGFIVNDEVPLPDIARKLCALVVAYPKARGHIITALTKITAQLGSCLPEVVSTIQKFGNSKDTDVQQRCLELTALLRAPDLMKEVLPVDASTEDIDIDEDLSFLDEYVQSALDNGAKRYNPPNESDFAKLVAGLGDDDDENENGLGLRYEAYEQPTIPVDFGGVGGGDEDGNEDDEEDNFDDGDGGEGSATVDGKDAMLFAGMNQRSSDMDDDDVSRRKRKTSFTAVKGPWGEGGYVSNKPKPKTRTSSKKAIRDSIEGRAVVVDQDEDADVAEAIRRSLEDQAAKQAEEEMEEQEEEEPEKPREASEREKLAAGLFGGMGQSVETTRKSRWGRRRRGRKSPPKTQTAANNDVTQSVSVSAKSTSQQPDDDLLGGLFGDTGGGDDAIPATTVQSNADDAGDLGDMLGGLDMGDGTSDEIVDATRPPAESGSSDLLGGLGTDDFGDAGTEGNVVNNDTSVGGGMDDLFGGLGSNEPDGSNGTMGSSDLFGVNSTTIATSSVSVPDLENITPTADITRLVLNHPRFPTSKNARLDSHGSLHFSYFKVHRPKDLLLVLYVANGGDRPAQYRIDIRSNGQGVRSIVSCAGGNGSGKSSFMELPIIPSEGVVAVQISLSCTQSTGLLSQAVNVAFQSPTSSAAAATIPVDARDWLRPKRMSTKQFGGVWTKALRQGMKEKKVSIATRCPDLDTLVQHCEAKLGIYPIETIHKTNEHIAALHVVGQDALMLLHVKFSNSKRTALMTIRGSPPCEEVIGKMARETLP